MSGSVKTTGVYDTNRMVAFVLPRLSGLSFEVEEQGPSFVGVTGMLIVWVSEDLGSNVYCRLTL